MARHVTTRWIIFVAPIAALLALTGCSSGSGEGLDANGRPLGEGGDTPPPAAGATFEALQANVFTPVCTVCHAGAAAPVGLKLDAGNSFDELVNVPSVQVPSLLRVAPGDPDNSYLIQKIEGTAGVGQQMPLGGPFLDADTVALLRAWIADGAPGPAPPAADVPPVVQSTSPLEGDVLAALPDALTINFSKPMDATLVSDTTVMLIASADGQFDNGDDLVVIPAALTLDATDGQRLTVDLTGVTLADDSYRLMLVGLGATVLADTQGLALDGDADGAAGGNFMLTFDLATTAPPPQATWRSIQDEVFTPACIVCHVAGGQASFLPLDEANSYDALVGVPSTEVPSLLRVEPLDADNSYLVQKLEGTAAVGARMPLGGDPLPDTTIAAVRAWINAGALRMPGDPLPDVVAPAVVVAAPLGELSGTVTLVANASDASGVAGVDFFVDEELLSRDTVEPFEATFDTTQVDDGERVLLAVAQDVAGNEGQSSPLTVVVNNAPPPDTEAPTVALVDPGATLGGTVTLTATAGDNVGVTLVRFEVDGVVIATDTDAPYSASWDTTSVADGPHTLTATAQDAAGNTGNSDALTVQVDNAPPPDIEAPTVSLQVPASPLAGTVVAEVTASDNVGVTAVRFLIDDQTVAQLSSPPFLFDLDTTTLADGSYMLRAEADDAAGNVGMSPAVVIDVDNAGPGDVVPPVTEVVDPGLVLTGDVQISATASDDTGVVDVVLIVDGVDNATDIAAPYLFELDTTALTDGMHTLQTRARDAAGNVGLSAVVTVTVDNADRVPPDVQLNMPPDPADGSITVSAVANDDEGVAAVTILIDGVVAGVASTSPYEVVVDTTSLADGAHVVAARAEDAAGNVGAAAPLLLNVANGGPQPTLPWIQEQVFDAGCTVGCHVTDGIASFLRLDADNAFAELVNVPATRGGSSLRVTPGDPDDSALVQRLEGTLTPSMPLGGSLLPQSEIDAVRAWIESGAAEVPPDVIAPAITLTAPVSPVSGEVAVVTAAVDNVAVTQVRLYVDNVEVGQVNSAPFEVTWDSGDVADGEHTLRADAVDAAGNVGVSLDRVVTVANGVP